MIRLTRKDEPLVADVVFLSPHLDDAALSCGGLIAGLVRDGQRVLVVTVFAGFPASRELSAFAAQLHARWGRLASLVTVRRDEDETAMGLLGAEWLHLEYPDAIYRFDEASFLYLDDEDLFGSPHPSDLGLVARLAESVTEICHPSRPKMYAPLAVGNHVDHQLVMETALILLRRSFRVVFYEDYPYVEVPGALTTALQGTVTRNWSEEVQGLKEEYLAAKIQAIAAYNSQIDELFQTAEKMARRVRDYALAVSSSGGYVERYWRLSAGTHARADKQRQRPLGAK